MTNQEYVESIANELNSLALDHGSAWDGLREYLTDNHMDAEYTLDDCGVFIGARVYIGLHPKTWIDTRDGSVVVDDNGERAIAWLGFRTQELLNDICENDCDWAIKNGCTRYGV